MVDVIIKCNLCDREIKPLEYLMVTSVAQMNSFQNGYICRDDMFVYCNDCWKKAIDKKKGRNNHE
jgi:hypothetical protein